MISRVACPKVMMSKYWRNGTALMGRAIAPCGSIRPVQPLLRVVTLGLLLNLAACAGQPRSEAGDDQPSGGFDVRSLAKTDIDTVAELHIKQSMAYLRELMIKLYKRNPGELKKSGGRSRAAMVAYVFDRPHYWYFDELDNAYSIDAMTLAFDPSYRGDRVLALVAGLGGMTQASYGNKREFYFYDRQDPQRLYNAARNIEIVLWKLANSRDASGRLLLLSNSTGSETRNLSFERLFGKMIGVQDVMANVIADSSNRAIKHVIVRLASAVFFPI